MSKFLGYCKYGLFYGAWALYCISVKAQDMTSIAEIDDMLVNGQSMIKVAAKWGGILTVVGSAILLGRGRLEGALAQTICKILIVIGLLVAAFTYFGAKISWGFEM